MNLKHIFAALTLCFMAAVAQAAEKPNVVIIYGDDVGYGDVGAYGAKLIPTPNIDLPTDIVLPRRVLLRDFLY